MDKTPHTDSLLKSYDVDQLKALKIHFNGSWGTEQYGNGFRFLDIGSSEEGDILHVSTYGLGLGYNPPMYSLSDKLYVKGNVGIGISVIDNDQGWEKVFQLNRVDHLTDDVKVLESTAADYKGNKGGDTQYFSPEFKVVPNTGGN